ncbi:hypothetical protein [Desulfovibrio inopinatus]|uniref:hypothetical protein n=1 Tax=Desulfovibrio inopinatus TaxID=102109 RepID=UPI000483071B|nr:hypothetical protein [Desulfovibrio inopinatus]
MLIRYCFFILIFLSFSVQGLAENTTSQLKSSKAWKSFILDTEKEVMAVASTPCQQCAYGETLYLWRSPRNCSIQYMSILGRYGGERNTSKENLIAEGRVDERRIHKFRYVLNLFSNTGLYEIAFQKFSNPQGLLQDMVYGRSIFFKIHTKLNPIFLRFSLMGFTASAQRTYALCKKLHQQHQQNKKTPLPIDPFQDDEEVEYGTF